MVTRIDVYMQRGDVSVYWLWLLLYASAVSVVILRFLTYVDRNSHCVNVCIFIIRICNFSNFVALCTDDTDTPVSCDKRLRFSGICSNLSPISSNVSSVRTWHRRLTFLFFTEPVYLNLLACLLIVLGLGTGRPGNFIRNLRRISEHDFLLFIYVLWIYTMRIPV